MKQTIQKERQKQIISDEKGIQPISVNNPKEKGRSMVEMLGVLAVIGVLSVAGIMGYKYGMMKYRVNETINELNIMANTYGVQMQQMIKEQVLPTDGELLSEEGALTRMGYAYEVWGFDDHFELFLFNVPNAECEQLQKTWWAMPYKIEVTNATAESCGQLIYLINNDLTGLPPEIDSSDEDDTTEEKPLDCGLYGTFTNNRCVCDEGYTGRFCNQCDTAKGYEKKDSNGKCYVDCQATNSCTNENYCNGQAYWVETWDGRFYCKHCNPGYWGTHCENYDPSGDACNGQSAGYGWMNSTYVNGCDCDDEHWGDHCEYLKDEKPECHGHGTVYGYGTCICEEGFSGDYCENEEPGIPCGVDLGSGMKSGYMMYENETAYCQCVNGYTGSDCKTPPSKTCSNGSWNYSQGGDNPMCECDWSHCGPNCSGQGANKFMAGINTCVSCSNGYTGENCTTPPTENCNTSNRAWKYIDKYTVQCVCRNDHASRCGPDCNGYGTNSNENGVDSCLNCRDGYTGENCTIPPTQNCSYPKAWYYTDKNTVVCACRQGYVGSSCKIACKDENGTWKLENGIAKCECFPGKSGEGCENG